MTDGRQLPTYTPPGRDGSIPCVLSHVTYSRDGEQYSEANELAIMFHDRAIIVSVEDVITESLEDGDAD